MKFSAQIERVFAFACDSKRTHEWAGWISNVDAGDGFAAVGQHVHGTGRLLGRSMEMESDIVEFERPRLLSEGDYLARVGLDMAE